ncbi:MAG TPA: hypothetical protein VGV91_09160 [Rubrobacter sp.]|nr:hypothetical protein [Rubrobacter sp.]
MPISGAARALLIVGRLVGFAAAAFAMVLMAKPGYELFRYVFFSGSLTWAGIIPVVFVLRICVAGWVAWAVLRFDGRGLMRALLAAFGVSFLLLYGWYFLLLGMNDALFYWIVTGDFLAAGLLVGSASIPSTRTRGGESHA